MLPTDPEAGLRDLGEHQNGVRLGPEFLRQRHAGVQLLQGGLRRTRKFGGVALFLVLSD